MMMHKRINRVAKHDGNSWVIEDRIEYQWLTTDGKQELSEWFKHLRGAIDFAIDYDIRRINDKQ